MARTDVDGAVWGRPESLDSLGWRPGRARRIVATLLGVASLVVGAWLGASALTERAGGPAVPDPDAKWNALIDERTCASVGVVVPANRKPAQGIPEAVVVSLYSTKPTGESIMLTPRSHVLSSVDNPDGSVNLSVLVRMGPPGDNRQVADVAGASAAGTLTASVLYDVDPIRVLDECRERTP